MTTWETVYNPGPVPRACGPEGRVVEAHGWGTADVTCAEVAADIAAGRLVVVATPDPVPSAGIDQRAADAMRETLRRRQQQSRLLAAEEDSAAARTASSRTTRTGKREE
ncbi:hypothetical protein [Carbonactinospora thermoautotrophica]|nr:hypothetical protein [Carbonactinospora thermoautotrophica]